LNPEIKNNRRKGAILNRERNKEGKSIDGETGYEVTRRKRCKE
jgi:hypothetical protein